MLPNVARHLVNDALLMPCSRHCFAAETPLSAWRRTERIKESLYWLIFVQNFLIH